MASPLTQNLARHKTLAAAAGVLLLAYLYLRNRSAATAVAGTTDPTALSTVPDATDGSLAAGGTTASTSGSSDTQALAAALEDIGSQLADVQTQQAQDETSLQSVTEAAAQLTTAWNDQSTLGTLNPSQFTIQQLAALGSPSAGPSPFSDADTLALAHKFGSMTPAQLTALGVGPQPARATTPTLTPFEAKRDASSPTPAATLAPAPAPILQQAAVAAPAAVGAAQPHAAEYTPPGGRAVIRGAVAV